MNIVEGKYTSAVVFSDTAEDYAVAQIKQLCDNAAFKDSCIRIMPDVHPAKVGPVGFTATVNDRILPAIVGVDIGCGMTITKLGDKRVDNMRLDKVIRENVPVGPAIRDKCHRFADDIELAELNCAEHIRPEKAYRSIGTLGGGNHFIEVDRDEDGNLYLMIHSGSRSLGIDVAEHYMRKGQECAEEKVPYELSYVEGELMQQYLDDVQFVQRYAELNRMAISDEILRGMKWKASEQYSCVHNYIDSTDGKYLIRKGAISAKEGERVIIPINMRDGVILGVGKGNADWNCSAPHGAGRIYKREDVKKHHTLSEFKKEMKGIYSPSINSATLDEGPFAYRRIDEILDAIKNTVDVTEVIKPVYNFKAGGE